MKIVDFWVEEGAECPTDFDSWKMVSFNHRHYNYEDRTKYDCEETADSLQKGKAFLLRYSEHGPQCIWNRIINGDDLSDSDGIMIWEGEDIPDCKWADGFLETYTNWCNGEVYGFSVYEAERCNLGHVHKKDLIDSCGGFYGYEPKESGLFDMVKEMIGDENDFLYEGYKDLVDYFKIK